MKKFLIIGVLAALLCAGGTAIMAEMGMGPFAVEQKPGEEAKKAEEAPKPDTSPDLYYELGSFIVPMVGKDGVGLQVGVDLALKVAAKDGPRISADLPRLQNAITFDLYDFLPHHADARSIEDRKAVHDHLLKLAVRMYGDKPVRDVIVKSMYERGDILPH